MVDANILIRAVLGRRVREMFESFADGVILYIPETAYLEAREHLASLLIKRGGDPDKGLNTLDAMASLGTVVTGDAYGGFEAEARQRLAARDPDDWPILATAIALGCPIWTEDADFFGCGVATWTSANIRRFFGQ